MRFMIGFVLYFIIVFVIAMIVDSLYTLILYGSIAIDWGLAFTIALFLSIIFSFISTRRSARKSR